MASDARIKEALSRASHRVAELMIEEPHWPLQVCIDVAWYEERFINGDPRSTLTPRGLMSTPSHRQKKG